MKLFHPFLCEVWGKNRKGEKAPWSSGLKDQHPRKGGWPTAPQVSVRVWAHPQEPPHVLTSAHMGATGVSPGTGPSIGCVHTTLLSGG